MPHHLNDALKAIKCKVPCPLLYGPARMYELMSNEMLEAIKQCLLVGTQYAASVAMKGNKMSDAGIRTRIPKETFQLWKKLQKIGT